MRTWGVLISVGKWRRGASHLLSSFQSFKSGSATAKGITKLKAHLRVLTASRGKWPALSPDLRESDLTDSQNNAGWKGLLGVICSTPLLKAEPASQSDQVAQGFCPVKFCVASQTYPTQSLCAPLPVRPLSQCKIFFFTSNWNFLCCNLCLRQLKTAIGSLLAYDSFLWAKQTQLPKSLQFLFLYPYELLQQISKGYLKRLHHKLRIHKKNSTDAEFPLLKLLHQLFHHRQMRVEFDLT